MAASVLGAIFRLIENPRAGLRVPDDIGHERVPEIANPCLGPCPPVRADRRPDQYDYAPFRRFKPGKRSPEPWAFGNFLIS